MQGEIKNFGNKNPEYIPLSEAGKILNTSRDYMNVLVRRGKLHAVKLGRNWVTTREWIDEYQKAVGRTLEIIPKPGIEELLEIERADLSAEALAKAEQIEFKDLKVKLAFEKELTERLEQIESKVENISALGYFEKPQTFKDKEVSKKAASFIVSQEIELPSRKLKSEEKSTILKAVEEQFKSADVSEFQKISKQLGILKSLKSWSHLKFFLASGFVALVLVVSLSVVSGLISLPNLPNFNGLKYQASIFSDVFSDFQSDMPSFSRWFTLNLSKGLTFLKLKPPSELAVGELPAGESKIIKPQEILPRIDTLDEALALDVLGPGEEAPQIAEGEIPAGGSVVSVGASEFQLLENRLSIVETDLKDQTDLINSELSLQKKTILGALETLFGLAKLVPSHPISSIVVQGQPATLTSYSVQPQINTGFDRLSASYLLLSNNAEINGSLTVKSGGIFNTLGVSGDTSLTGNATIGGTLNVTGDTTLGRVAMNNASTTNLTVSGNAWINQLSVTGTATTTFNNPIASASGDFIIAGDSANDLLLNPYGGNIGIGTTSPVSLLSVHSSGNVYFGGALTVSGNSLFSNATTTGLTVQGGTLLGSLVASNATFTTATSSSMGTTGGAYFATLGSGNAILGNATTTGLTVTGGSSFAAATFSQNVGVGTTTPTQALTIQGNQFIYGGLGVGMATTTSGAIQTSGDVFVGRNLYVSGNSTTLGASSADTLTINSSINSNLIPDQNALRDLGSSSYYWDDVYVDQLVANNISAASTTIGGTKSETFTINSDNASADSQNSEVIFFRGTVVPNALLTWNSATSSKRFEFNQVLYINDGSASTTNPTFTIQTIANQTANGLQVIDNNSTNLFSVSPVGSKTTMVNASTTNLTVSGATFLANATTTGLTVSGGSSLGSLIALNSSFSNATSTGGFSVTGGTQLNSLAFTVGTSTSFGVTGGAQLGALNVSGNTNLGNATTTGLTVSGGSNLGSLSALNVSFSNATTTGLSVNGGTLLGSLAFGNATGTALTINGGASLGSLGVTGLTNLADLIAGNATTTGLTVTGGASFNSITLSATSTMNGFNLCTSANGICASNLTGTTGQIAYFSGTNTAVGTSTLFISTAGNVGIGTTSPGSLLSVHSTGSVYFGGALTVSGNSLFNNATTTGLTVQGGTQLGSLAFGNATGTALTINGGASFGSLGVTGLTNLGNLIAGNATTTGLTVTGGASFNSITMSATSTMNGFNLCTSANGVCAGSLTGTTGQLAYFSGTNTAVGTSTLFISTAGNVGIASTSPSAVLSVNVSNANGTTPALNITSATSSLFFVRSDGNVGIGTTTPNYTLDVAGSAAFGTGVEAMRIDSAGYVGIGTSTPTQLLTISIAGDTANANIPNGALCIDNDGGCVPGAAGNITFRSSTTGGSDVAENYLSLNNLEAGDIVVSIGGINIDKATATSKTIIGIISTAPGMTLGFDESNIASSTYPVALIGRVPTKVSLENGAIVIGDRIAASSVAGVGMKAGTSTATTVGIALESFDGTTSSSTKILVFVNLGQPQLAASQGTGDLASMTIAGGDLNMNGFSIVNVKSIIGMNGLWKIDENGNITAQSVQTQSLTVGGGIASGVTIYDRETAAPKCIYIEGGVIKTSDEACGQTTNAGTEAIIQQATDTSVSETIPVATSTPPVATSTPPISETIPIATTTPEIIIATTTPEMATTTP